MQNKEINRQNKLTQRNKQTNKANTKEITNKQHKLCKHKTNKANKQTKI